MKIAYLFGSLNRGGTETLMLDIFTQLPKTPTKAIGIYRKDGILKDSFTATTIPMYHIPTAKNPFSYILKLRKKLLSERISIVHAQQPIDALYAYLACLFTDKKVFLTLHGFDYGASQKLHNFILKRTHKNIYVSDYVRNYYTQKYTLDPDNQKVVYNGVNFEKMDTKVKTSILPQKKIESPQATFKFAMVGNFVPGREQNTVCKFLKLLKAQNILFDFYFVGKKSMSAPHLYDDCVQFCTDNELDEVHFLGSRSDVPKILTQLDAFVYSTDHDTFGIAVVEAMAMGVPVFVNDWAVMREITEDGKLATLYKTKDENDLLEKFIVFLQNIAIEKGRAVSNVPYVRQKYNITNCIAHLLKVYDM